MSPLLIAVLAGIALVCRLERSRWLLVTLALAGFSATAVVNFAGFSVTLGQATGVVAVGLSAGVFRRASGSGARLVILAGVVVAYFASVHILSPVEAFAASRFGAIAYLGLGLCLAIAIVDAVAQRETTVGRLLGAFAAGSVLLSVLALIQVAAPSLYPGELLNTRTGDFVASTDEYLGALVFRSAAAATEPSFLARNLAVGFSISVYFVVVGGQRQRALRNPAFLGGVIVAGGIFASGSTTGIVGAAMGALLLALVGGASTARRFGFAATIAAGSLIVFLALPSVVQRLRDVTVGKVGGFSQVDRLDDTREAFRQAVDASPLVQASGLGIESVSSHSLPVDWFVWAGFLGTLLLLVLYGTPIGWGLRRRASVTSRACAVLLLVSLTMDSAAGWSYSYLETWLLLGIAWSSDLRRQRRGPTGPTIRTPPHIETRSVPLAQRQ